MAPLVDDVLGLVAEAVKGDKHSLRDASLVCRTWKVVFQRALFSRVDLQTTTSLQRFLDSITDSPHLSSLVHSLRLSHCFHRRTGPSVHVLCRLGGLRELRLVEHRFDQNRTAIDPGETARLLSGFSPLKLTHLRLAWVSCFPAAVLSNCVNLTHLFLEGCSFGDLDLIRKRSLPNKPPRYLSLRSLSLLHWDQDDFVSWLAEPSCFLRLDELQQLGASARNDLDRYHPMICRLVSLVAKSIHTLRLQPTDNGNVA